MVAAMQSASMHETLPPRESPLLGGQTDDEANQQLRITQYSGDPKLRPRNLLCPRLGCGRFYSSESALRNHLRLKHPFDGLRPKRQAATTTARAKIRQPGDDAPHEDGLVHVHMSTNTGVTAPSPHSDSTPTWSTPDPTPSYPYHPGSVPASGPWNQPHPYTYGSPYPTQPPHGYEYATSPSAPRRPPPPSDYVHRVSPNHHGSPYDPNYPYPPPHTAGPPPPPPGGPSSNGNSFYVMMTEEAVYSGAPHPQRPPQPPHSYSYHEQPYPNAYPGPPPHHHPMRRPSGSPVHVGAYGHPCECNECARAAGHPYGPPPPPHPSHYGAPAPAYSMAGPPPPAPAGPCMCPHCVAPGPGQQEHGYGHAHVEPPPPPLHEHMYQHGGHVGVHVDNGREGKQGAQTPKMEMERSEMGVGGGDRMEGGEDRKEVEGGGEDDVKMDEGKEVKKPKRRRSGGRLTQKRIKGKGKGKGKNAKKTEVKEVHSDSETEDDLPMSA